MNPQTALAWQPHPEAWALVILLGGAYLYALSAWGPRLAPGRRPATGGQRLCFLAGLATLWLASDWPVHQLSTQLFSLHMVQHLLYSLVAAPLLILGTPGWLFRRLFRHPRVESLVRVLTRPLVALLLFNTWVVLYHWPVLVNWSVHNDLFHFGAHVVWLATGLIMWWPVLSPLPELPHLPEPGRMFYLFGQSIVPTVPASFLTFAHVPLYTAYAVSPSLWGVSVIGDQQVAGLVMKLGGGALLWTAITVLFFRWAVAEERGGPDPLYWRDLEPEISQARSAE